MLYVVNLKGVCVKTSTIVIYPHNNTETLVLGVHHLTDGGIHAENNLPKATHQA